MPHSAEAHAGRAIYLANGCVYCHSYFTRPQDTFVGQYYVYTRTSEPGDYQSERESPNIFGTARTGPDMSQEGGMHPDVWHDAHYNDPRIVNPLSIMPSFKFLTDQERNELIAFNQESGGKEGVLRASAVYVGNQLMRTNMGMQHVERGVPRHGEPAEAERRVQRERRVRKDKSPSGLPWMEVWDLNSRERGYWLTPDPLPVTQNNLMRGKEIFLQALLRLPRRARRRQGASRAVPDSEAGRLHGHAGRAPRTLRRMTGPGTTAS